MYGNHKYNPMKCTMDECENDVLVCKAYAQTSEQNHSRYQNALAWMERNTRRYHNNQMGGQNRPDTSLIIVSKENELSYNMLVNEYFEPFRKDIHNRFVPGADRISNIF